MSLVNGKDWVGWHFDGGIWKPYVCARAGNFNINTGTIETTVTGSGDYKTFEPTVHDFSVEIDGVISLLVSGSLSLADLQAKQLAKEKLLWRFIQTDRGGNVYIKQAYFFITNSTDTGSFDGIATFSISMIGTGGITTIFTPPSPNNGEVYRHPPMGSVDPPTTGSTAWTVTGLGNKNILDFVKDGRGQSDIILSGTPVGNEVLYETVGSDGVFTSAIPYEDTTPPYVLYQNL